MDKIIIFVLFSTIGLFAKGDAQLHCFVCNNCPDVSTLDTNVVQNCDIILDPDDPDETTIYTTVSDDTDGTVDISTSTLTIPDFPPSTTPQQPSPPTDITDITDITTTQTTPQFPPSITTQQPSAPPDITTTQIIPEFPPSITTQQPSAPPDITTTQIIPEFPPSITTQQPSPPPPFGHKYKDVIRELVGTHQCFVVHRQVGDAIQVDRGCVATRETQHETCSIANFGQTPQYCRLCPTNECNIASKYTISLLIVLCSLFMVLIIR